MSIISENAWQNNHVIQWLIITILENKVGNTIKKKLKESTIILLNVDNIG